MWTRCKCYLVFYHKEHKEHKEHKGFTRFTKLLFESFGNRVPKKSLYFPCEPCV
jgi:hypothetical protein